MNEVIQQQGIGRLATLKGCEIDFDKTETNQETARCEYVGIRGYHLSKKIELSVTNPRLFYTKETHEILEHLKSIGFQVEEEIYSKSKIDMNGQEIPNHQIIIKYETFKQTKLI